MDIKGCVPHQRNSPVQQQESKRKGNMARNGKFFTLGSIRPDSPTFEIYTTPGHVHFMRVVGFPPVKIIEAEELAAWILKTVAELEEK